eukprot:Skav211085  [mRNA]  locus=scaffold2002:135379:136485:- [translate_table: standard]
MPITFDDLTGSMPERDRSRSGERARPEQDSRMETHQELPSQADLVQKVLGVSLPSMLLSGMRRVVRSFTDKIEELQKAIKRQDKQKKDLTTILGGHYPPGVPPFTPGSGPELDNVFPECLREECRIEVVIPQGSTRKRALEILHLHMASFNKKVDLEVTTEYVKNLQGATSFDKFMESAVQPEDEHVKALQGLGLTLPPGLPTTSPVSKEQALQLYLAMVNKIAEKKVDSDKAAAKETKEQDKLREAIRAKDPKDHFESAVKQALSNMAKKSVDPRVDYSQAAASHRNPAEFIDWAKTTESKRRFTKTQLAARKAQGKKGQGKADWGQQGFQTHASPTTSPAKQSKGQGQAPARHTTKRKGERQQQRW